MPPRAGITHKGQAISTKDLKHLYWEQYDPHCRGMNGRLAKNKKPVDSNRVLPAARAKFRLMLLPSGPDMIHSMTPHGTQLSSPTGLMIIAYPEGNFNPFSPVRAACSLKLTLPALDWAGIYAILILYARGDTAQSNSQYFERCE